MNLKITRLEICEPQQSQITCMLICYFMKCDVVSSLLSDHCQKDVTQVNWHSVVSHQHGQSKSGNKHSLVVSKYCNS